MRVLENSGEYPSLTVRVEDMMEEQIDLKIDLLERLIDHPTYEEKSAEVRELIQKLMKIDEKRGEVANQKHMDMLSRNGKLFKIEVRTDKDIRLGGFIAGYLNCVENRVDADGNCSDTVEEFLSKYRAEFCEKLVEGCKLTKERVDEIIDMEAKRFLKLEVE